MVLGQISSKMTKREFLIFIFFPDTYTCSYVVFQFWADSDQNLIFYEFFKLLKNWYYSTWSWAKFHQK